jgi:hypothetical protein
MNINIDSILTEWRFRLPYGYPKRLSDYKILEQILIEKGIEPDDAEQITQRAQNTDNKQTSRFVEIGLSNNIVQQIESIYSNMSSQEQNEFDNNYRTHSVDSYINGGYRAFQKFYAVIDTTKTAGAMGNGEVQTLLAVADSKPGGTAQHDIVMPTGEWEIKEVGKAKSNSKTFRPAKSGFPKQGDLLYETVDFFNNIVIPFSNMGDAFEELKQSVDDHSWNKLREFITVLNQSFVPLIDNVSRKEISYRAGWQTMYDGYRRLNKIFWQSDLDVDIQDTRLSIKSQDKESSFWIDSSDYNKIQQGAGSTNPVSVNIGQSIDNETSNSVIWFNKIKHNQLIKTPDMMISLLDATKTSFFNELLGLIIYDIAAPGVPIATTSSQWSIVGLTQGMWTFGLTRSFSEKYTIIHLQN